MVGAEYLINSWNPAQRSATRKVAPLFAQRLAELRTRIAEERWLLSVTRRELGKGYVQPHRDALGHDAQRREVAIELLAREVAALEVERDEMIKAERLRILTHRKRVE
jgi:hypothetical protein